MKIKELDLTNPTMIAAAVRLYCEVFNEEPWREKWDPEVVRGMLAKPSLRWWVLHGEDGEIIGFTAGAVAAPSVIATDFEVPIDILTEETVGYLSEVGVSPKYRRGGLARELSNTMLAHFRAAAVDQFVVRTRPGANNFGWYASLLTPIHNYPDGRVIFGCRGVPTL